MKTLSKWLQIVILSTLFALPMSAIAHGGGWHGGGGGWHGGGWHGGGWHGGGRGYYRGGVYFNVGPGYYGYPYYGYYGPYYGYRCAWVRGHYNAYGYWIPAHRACW